jgi:hypothetical protein
MDPAKKRAWRQRVNVWVANRRAALVTQLGGRCQICGTTMNLEFHHPTGRPYEPRRMGRHNRIAAYYRDAAAGNLGLLCRSCNARDGAQRMLRDDWIPL